MNLANVSEVSRFAIVVKDKGSMILACNLKQKLGEFPDTKINLRGNWVLNKSLLSTYYVPTIVLGSWVTAANEIDQISVLVELYLMGKAFSKPIRK